MLARLGRVLSRVQVVAVGNVCMVSGLLVFTSFVMLCRFAMMTSGVLVVLGGFRVM
jgi:hypothetical protein